MTRFLRFLPINRMTFWTFRPSAIVAQRLAQRTQVYSCNPVRHVDFFENVKERIYFGVQPYIGELTQRLMKILKTDESLKIAEKSLENVGKIFSRNKDKTKHSEERIIYRVSYWNWLKIERFPMLRHMYICSTPPFFWQLSFVLPFLN